MFRMTPSLRSLLLIVLAIGFVGAIRAADDDEAARARRTTKR